MLGAYVLSEGDWQRAYGNPCGAAMSAGLVLIDGRSLRCRKEAVAPFQAWERIRARHKYRLTGDDTGIISCRHQRHDPKLPWSVHAWGGALDVNWLENPAGSKLITDIPKAMRDEILALRTNSGARVFRWGGDWDNDGMSNDHTYIDAMHWEVIAHPLDLATGIKEGDIMHPPTSHGDFIAEHKIPAPPSWSHWEEYAAASGSNAGSGGWPAGRYDIAWFWFAVVRPLADRCAELERRNNALHDRLAALEARVKVVEDRPTGGGGALPPGTKVRVGTEFTVQ
jgi:hypothetical protein